MFVRGVKTCALITLRALRRTNNQKGIHFIVGVTSNSMRRIKKMIFAKGVVTIPISPQKFHHCTPQSYYSRLLSLLSSPCSLP